MRPVLFILLACLISVSGCHTKTGDHGLPKKFYQSWQMFNMPITLDIQSDGVTYLHKDSKGSVINRTKYKLVGIYDDKVVLLTRDNNFDPSLAHLLPPKFRSFEIVPVKDSRNVYLLERTNCPYVDEEYWDRFEEKFDDILSLAEKTYPHCLSAGSEQKYFTQK